MKYSDQTAFLSPGRIRGMQEQKLGELLAYLKQCSPYYSRRFREHQVDISHITTLEDLTSLPVTTKEDLQRYNEDFICVDKTRIIEYTSTSGTLGSPVTVALTEGDLSRLAHNEYVSFLCAGGSPQDIYQLMLTLDRQFMAGMA